jgi:hypothetical protein
MDVFKLAFETIIVGLLTFVWLGFATYLLFPEFLKRLVGWIDPAVDKYKAALGLGILTIAYCLGSAVSPIAKQLVNDEHWPLNEDAIRCQVAQSLQKNADDVQCSHWSPLFKKDEKMEMRDRIRLFRRLAAPLPGETQQRGDLSTSFQQKEAEILLKAHDNAELLTQLSERIVVLRGAVFSGFVLLMICLSAYFARINGGESHWVRWIRPGCGLVLAAIFTTFALLNGLDDLHHGISDPPVLESLLLVITIFGVVVVAKGAKAPLLRAKRYVLIALLLTGLSYGGWVGSEILYDQQVLNWHAVLPK